MRFDTYISRMVTSYGDRHDRRYIEDLRPPDAGDGFDVRQPRVRHRAIGALDDHYLRFRNLFSHTSSDMGIHIPVRIRHGYTRIPPLSTIELPAQPPLWQSVERTSRLFGTAATRFRSFMATAAATMSTFFAGAAYGLRHLLTPHGEARKYSLGRGAYAGWSSYVWVRLRWMLLPAAIAVALLFLLVIPLERSTTSPHKESSGSARQTTKQHNQATGSGASGTSTTKSPTTAQAPSTSAPTRPVTAPPGTGSTSTAGAIDPPAPVQSGSTAAPTPTPVSSSGTGSSSGSGSTGSSGGSTGSGSSSSGSGLLPDTQVTLPPVKATIGGKQLIDASGTSLTLN